MNRLGSQLLALTAALCTFLPRAHAFESDTNTVGYTDYGGASYFRDYCHDSTNTSLRKVHGISIEAFRSSGILANVAAECQHDSQGGNWRYTPPRGAPLHQSFRPIIACPNLTDAVDGLRGYSDAGGVTSIAVSCNNGSYSTNLAAMEGASGPYYNSVRCPSGNVAWGVWSSVGNSRVGRLGMICNNWWP